MEPQNFTVSRDVWFMRDVGRLSNAGGRCAVLPLRLSVSTQKNVTFHNLMLGGGFGRRLDVDMVVKAVRIAQKIDGP